MLNKRIRDQREDHDKTQNDIANILDISRVVYNRYENGINEMPIRHLKTLCLYYNISADYFLGLIDEPKKIYQ